MTIVVANTELVNNFDTWRLNTNYVATLISNNVVTIAPSTGDAAGRNNVSRGDGHIKGLFTANELRTVLIKGGNTSSEGSISIQSNTAITSNYLTVTSDITTINGNTVFNQSGLDTVRFSGGASRLRITGGVAGQYMRNIGSDTMDFEHITFRQLTNLSSNSSPIVLSGANTDFSDTNDSTHLVFTNGLSGTAHRAKLFFANSAIEAERELIVQVPGVSNGAMSIRTSANTSVARFNASGEAVFSSNVTSVGITTSDNILPAADDSVDLGSTNRRFKNAYVDGIGYIDQLNVGTAASQGVGTSLIPLDVSNYNLGSTTYKWNNLYLKGDLQGSTGTMTGAFTVQGAFTSKGIDDNASAERLQIADSNIALGATGISYAIQNAVDNTVLQISGGNSTSSGANIILDGGASPTTGDMELRNDGNTFLKWDESAGSLVLSGGTGAKISSVTVQNDANVVLSANLDVSATSNLGTADITTANITTDNVTTLILSTTASEGVASHILPTATDTYDLGASGRVWNELYVTDVQSSTGTFSSNLTVQGAFTSKGIDDNASAERLQIADSLLSIGGSGSYTIGHAVNTQGVVYSGGNANTAGGNMYVTGGTNTNAGDMYLRSGSNAFLAWDESTGTLTLSHGKGSKDAALTINNVGTVTVANNFTLASGKTATLPNATITTAGITTGNITTLNVSGTTNLNGTTINLGNASGDNIYFKGKAKTSLIPNYAENVNKVPTESYDLGTSTAPWYNLYANNVISALIDSTSIDVENLTVSNSLTIPSNIDATLNEVQMASLTVTGNASIEGDITLGNASADTLAINALINSSLLPEANNHNIGSSTYTWNQGYFQHVNASSSIKSDGTLLFGKNGKLHANNTITSKTITSGMLANANVNIKLTDTGGVIGSTTNHGLGTVIHFDAGEGINFSRLANSAIQILGENATTSNKGVASFSSTDFTVTSGAVSLKNTITAGSVGSSTEVPVITYNDAGMITGTSTASVSGITGATYTQANNTIDIATGTGAIYNVAISSATTTSGTGRGVASFDTGDFSLTSGHVTLKNSTSGAVLSISGTTKEVNVSRTNGTVTVGLPDDVTITSDLMVGGGVFVSGNLVVSGTTTTVNTETIELADNIITLNSNYTGSAPTENGGIEIERGTLANRSLIWNEITDRWQFTNDGTVFENIPTAGEYNNYSFTVEEGNGTEQSVINNGNVLKLAQSSGMQVEMTGADTFTFTNTDRGSSQNIFKSFVVDDLDSGHTWASIGAITANQNNSSATIVDGNGIDIDASPTTRAIRIQHSDTSSASSINVNNSNGTVLQDATITLDGYGHVTGLSTASVNLDTRYYTESEIDTKLTNGTVTKLANQWSNTTGNLTGFVNDGGGNLGFRFNAAGTSTNTLVEPGQAWEIEVSNDNDEGDFVFYRGTTENGLAGDAITWNTCLTLDGAAGTVIASNGFSGDGSSLTSLDASNISSGTIGSARLPAASSTIRGGIELFSDTVQSVGAAAVTATASRTYGIQINSSGQAVVNVPWTNVNANYVEYSKLDDVGTSNVTSGAYKVGVYHTELSNSASTTVQDVLDDLDAAITTLQGTDIGVTLTGDVTGSGTITNLGDVSFATTIAANSVALGTDTTGNYVGTITGGSGITSTGATSGEGISHTLSLTADGRIGTGDRYYGNTSDYMFCDASVGLRWYTAGGEDMRLTDAGDLHVDGDVIAYSTTISDERLKDDIQTLQNPFEILNAIRGVTFTRKDTGKESAGVIAQEIESVMPSAITEKELPLHTGDEETKYKTVEYDQIHAVLIEAIKEQQKTIDDLKSRLDKMESK